MPDREPTCPQCGAPLMYHTYQIDTNQYTGAEIYGASWDCEVCGWAESEIETLGEFVDDEDGGHYR